MEYKTKVGLVSLVGTILLGAVLFLRDLEDFICSESYYCSVKFENLDYHFFLTSLTIFITLTVLLFFKSYIFEAWFKFVAIFIPLAIILIITSSPEAGGFLGGIPPSERDLVMMGLGLLYTIITLTIIIYQVVKERKKNRA